MTVEEIDIWRAAKQLIDRHADDAVIEALMRADAALDRGDMFNFNVWKRAAKAVAALQKQNPSTGEKVN